MRTQYHFQPSPGGRAAWNVQRLIGLSADLPVVEVPLSRFEPLLDTVHWFDALIRRRCVGCSSTCS